MLPKCSKSYIFHQIYHLLACNYFSFKYILKHQWPFENLLNYRATFNHSAALNYTCPCFILKMVNVPMCALCFAHSHVVCKWTTFIIIYTNCWWKKLNCGKNMQICNLKNASGNKSFCTSYWKHYPQPNGITFLMQSGWLNTSSSNYGSSLIR